MSIETVGRFQKVLDGFNSNEWAQSAKLENSSEFGIEGGESFASIPKTSFADLLAKSVGEVNDLQKEANMAIQKLATGENKNLHETMLMVEQAELAFKAMNQVRLKVLDAYREIMKMQV